MSGAPLGSLLHFRGSIPTPPPPRPRPRLVLMAGDGHVARICAFCGRSFLVDPGQPFTSFCRPACQGAAVRQANRREKRGQP